MSQTLDKSITAGGRPLNFVSGVQEACLLVLARDIRLDRVGVRHNAVFLSTEVPDGAQRNAKLRRKIAHRSALMIRQMRHLHMQLSSVVHLRASTVAFLGWRGNISSNRRVDPVRLRSSPNPQNSRLVHVEKISRVRLGAPIQNKLSILHRPSLHQVRYDRLPL